MSLVAVTGAFSFTGRSIAEELIAHGVPVRTLVRAIPAAHSLAGRVDARAVDLAAPADLRAALDGVETLYNTHWIRYERGAMTFEAAIANSLRLFAAAREARVQHVVHISVTGADVGSPIPYYRAKGVVEEGLRATGLPHSVVRPTLLFGRDDVLVNNLAWFLRRAPVFALFGRGRYHVQPVFVDDVARIAVDLGRSGECRVVDAAGPERFEFREFVRLVRDAVGSRARLVALPPALALASSRLAGVALRDVVLTRDEIHALRRELLTSSAPPLATTRPTSWLAMHGMHLGHHYVNDLERHFGPRGAGVRAACSPA